MAKYTIELGKLIESGFKVFDETWGTFQPDHKRELESKIIGHYYFNEIGAETPDRFKHYINQHLREIMPYYNKMYESCLYDLAPLYNTIIERTIKGNSNSSSLMQQVNRNDSESLKRMGESIRDDFTGDEWATLDKTEHGVKDTIGNLTANRDEDETIQVNETENYTKDIDRNLDETINRSIGETTNSKETFDGNVNSTTKGSENESTTGTKWSSDTPQGEIVNNTFSVDSHYLTNYEHSSANRNRTYSEENSTKTDNVTDYTKNVDTLDDTVRNLGEKVKEVFSDTKSSHSDRVKNNKEVEDTTGFEDATTTTKQVEHKSTKTTDNKFSDSTENMLNTNIGSIASSGSDTTTDSTTYQELSNIGISKSKLVMEYRHSILNVDTLIIKELANNFMGVF